VAEAGAMMYKDTTVIMETIFGDGSGTGGGASWTNSSGREAITHRESLFMTVFTNTGSGKARVAFGAPYPGNIIPLHLEKLGGSLICQKDSFLCAAKGVSIGIFFQRKSSPDFSEEKDSLCKSWTETAGFHACRRYRGRTTIECRGTRSRGYRMRRGLRALGTVDIQQAGGIKTALFGERDCFSLPSRGRAKSGFNRCRFPGWQDACCKRPRSAGA